MRIVHRRPLRGLRGARCDYKVVKTPSGNCPLSHEKLPPRVHDLEGWFSKAMDRRLRHALRAIRSGELARTC